MSKKPTPSTEARDLRALLAAVLDAITLPYDLTDYDPRILRRASLARIVAREALGEDPKRLGWNTDYLQRKLAEEETEAAERGERP